MGFYSEPLLLMFVVVWVFLLLGVGATVRKRGGEYHYMDLTPWAVRGFVLVVFVLIVIFAQYEPSVSSFLGVQSIYPLFVLMPFQTMVDAIGAFMLHRKGRHHVEQLFTFNFLVVLPYLALPPFLLYEYLAKRRERLARLWLEELALSLPPWMRLILLCLNKYGWAKRRRDLNLTQKRSQILAKMGLAEENERGTLTMTQLGRAVAEIVARREDGPASIRR